MKKFTLLLITFFVVFTIQGFGQTVTNGGFESWSGGLPDGWTLNSDGTDLTYSQASGQGVTGDALKIVANSNGGSSDGTFYTSTYISGIVAGNDYDIKIQVRSNDDKVKIRYWDTRWYDASNNQVGSDYDDSGYNPVTSDTWTEYYASGASMTAPANATQLRVHFRVYVQSGFTGGTTYILVDDLTVTNQTGGSTPTITVSSSTLTGFTYVEGNGPSGEQTFTVSGSDLTADIGLSAPTNYEISETSGSGFTNSITLTQTAGSVATTTIHTRLKASLSVGDYDNEDVTASSTGAVSKTVTCSGSVSNAITVSPSTLTGFTYVEGSGPSAEQTFTVSGSGLTADIGLSAPTNYEISEATGSGFTGSITLTQSGGSVVSTTIYTRLKASLSAGTYNDEDISASSTGATTQTVTCSGSVTSSGGSGCATDLIISEVDENGGQKYIEIANFTGAAVSLADYDLVMYTNGSSSVSGTIDLTDGSSIPDQDVWVVANSSSTGWTGTPDQLSGGLTFNGNDVLALRKTSMNIDVFGTIGSSSYFYDNKTVIRNSSVTSPTTTYASSDWTFTAYAGGDPADLGQHTMSCGGSAPVDPTGFVAATSSATQIDLSWTQNGNTDAVMVVFNSSAITATPTDGTAYAVGATFADGSAVIYNQSGTSYNHTSLTSNTQYFYKAWSVDGSDDYSGGVIDDATTLKNEPSNHVGSFVAGAPTSTSIPLTWADNDGTVVADGYLIRINTDNDFTTLPVDLTPEADDTDLADDVGQVNVAHGVETYTWTGLKTGTIYYFAIYPYTNSGALIDYKTAPTAPTTSATTLTANKDLMITEVVDPGDNADGRFVEIYNAGSTTIVFSSDTWYLGRQANGGNWEDILLTGTMAAGESFVIAYGADFTKFSAAYSFDPDMSSGHISGNGNDGYFLYFGGDHDAGTLIDAYGLIDTDGDGEDWDYENSKAVRKRGVTGPVTAWDPDEWVISPADVQDMTPTAWKEDVIWQGVSTIDATNFNEVGANWNGTHGFVPDASYNVTVPNVTNKPIVTRLSIVNTITVQASSSIEVDEDVTITVLE